MTQAGDARVLVSQREFARLRNCNPGMVAKWKRRGVLVMQDGLVDVSASILKIEASRNPAMAHMDAVNARQRAQHRGQGAPAGAGMTGDAAPGAADMRRPGGRASAHSDGAEEDEIRIPSPGMNAKFMDAKTKREQALANIAVLELAQKAGRLVEREPVERAALAYGRMIRDAVMGMPSRLAPRLVSMTNEHEVEQLLDMELRSILTDIAKLGDADLARALAGETAETH